MLKKIVAEVLNVDPKEINPETTFVDDLGADSLDLLQIVMAVEEQFNLSFDEEELAEIITVNDALNKIREAVKE